MIIYITNSLKQYTLKSQASMKNFIKQCYLTLNNSSKHLH